MRERFASRALKVLAPNAAVPLEHQGHLLRDQVYAVADALLDELTAPPTPAMVQEGIGTLRDSSKGKYRLYDPTGFYARMATSVWEAMTRAMVEEGK